MHHIACTLKHTCCHEAESGCLCSGEGEAALKTMKYRRLNTDFVSTDPFTGLYLAAFGSHGPEVLQLQREPDAVDVRSPPACSVLALYWSLPALHSPLPALHSPLPALHSYMLVTGCRNLAAAVNICLPARQAADMRLMLAD